MNKKVLHYKDGQYLPLTETWIYGQISHHQRFDPVIYCREAANLDIYPTRVVRSKRIKESMADPWTLVHKTLNKLLQFYPQDFVSLSKDRPSLIHAHYGPAGFSLLRLKKIFRIPLITTFYGFDLSMLPGENPRWIDKYKKLFREGDLFLVEGSHMKNCLTRLGCRTEKIVVYHLGVDLEKIKFAPRRIKHGESINLLAAGSFREKKGMPYSIAALGNVVKKYPQLKIQMTIIGDSGGSDREIAEKKKILSCVEEYGLGACVKFLGYQPHSVFIEELYKNHLFISPSVTASDGDTEGGAPVSLIEASASGMPVISSNHCDIPEVIVDGQSGYLAPERDIDALSEKLEYMVAHPEKWESMGLAGRKHIEENYDVKKQGHRLEEIYDRATGRVLG
jgi:colanic acid/amylovoran biosynthesis glycosyltransferase